jgi:hypothetical protein
MTDDSKPTAWQRQQYPDTNKVADATIERRKTWFELLAGDMDVYDKMVLIYLMSFGGTTRDIRTAARELRLGHGEIDRAMTRLKGMGLARRPDTDCAGLDIDRHPDLGKLLEPLVDRTQRGVHLRAAPKPKLAALTPQQVRREEEAERQRLEVEAQAEASAQKDGLRKELPADTAFKV